MTIVYSADKCFNSRQTLITLRNFYYSKMLNVDRANKSVTVLKILQVQVNFKQCGLNGEVGGGGVNELDK